MKKTITNKKFFTLTGITLVLIFIILFLPKHKESFSTTLIHEEVSPFYPKLPEKYVKLINDNELTQYTTTIENTACRELIIIKNAPNSESRARNFDVEIFFNNQKKTSKLDNDAALYRYHHKLYAIFKKHLPFVDIEKITITK